MIFVTTEQNLPQPFQKVLFVLSGESCGPRGQVETQQLISIL